MYGRMERTHPYSIVHTPRSKHRGIKKIGNRNRPINKVQRRYNDEEREAANSSPCPHLCHDDGLYWSCEMQDVLHRPEGEWCKLVHPFVSCKAQAESQSCRQSARLGQISVTPGTFRHHHSHAVIAEPGPKPLAPKLSRLSHKIASDISPCIGLG